MDPAGTVVLVTNGIQDIENKGQIYAILRVQADYNYLADG
jgi:hypothetical protein